MEGKFEVGMISGIQGGSGGNSSANSAPGTNSTYSRSIDFVRERAMAFAIDAVRSGAWKGNGDCVDAARAIEAYLRGDATTVQS